MTSKQNPWSKRHPDRKKPNPWTQKVSLTTLVKRRDAIRDELFAAGWKPSTYMQPVTDPRIKAIMRKLNNADVAITRKIIGA